MGMSTPYTETTLILNNRIKNDAHNYAKQGPVFRRESCGFPGRLEHVRLWNWCKMPPLRRMFLDVPTVLVCTL